MSVHISGHSPLYSSLHTFSSSSWYFKRFSIDFNYFALWFMFKSIKLSRWNEVECMRVIMRLVQFHVRRYFHREIAKSSYAKCAESINSLKISLKCWRNGTKKMIGVELKMNFKLILSKSLQIDWKRAEFPLKKHKSASKERSLLKVTSAKK